MTLRVSDLSRKEYITRGQERLMSIFIYNQIFHRKLFSSALLNQIVCTFSKLLIHILKCGSLYSQCSYEYTHPLFS